MSRCQIPPQENTATLHSCQHPNHCVQSSHQPTATQRPTHRCSRHQNKEMKPPSLFGPATTIRNEKCVEIITFIHALNSQQIRDIDKVFQSFFSPQTNSCESCKKISEKYYRWFDGYIFRNEKPIKLLIFIYAFYSQ